MPEETPLVPTPGDLPQPFKPGYKTSHEIALELLAMPNRTAIVPTPLFDMPGGFNAFPVRIEELNIEGVNCIAFCPAPPEKKT
jgi:hypothetical protein